MKIDNRGYRFEFYDDKWDSMSETARVFAIEDKKGKKQTKIVMDTVAKVVQNGSFHLSLNDLFETRSYSSRVDYELKKEVIIRQIKDVVKDELKAMGDEALDSAYSEISTRSSETMFYPAVSLLFDLKLNDISLSVETIQQADGDIACKIVSGNKHLAFAVPAVMDDEKLAKLEEYKTAIAKKLDEKTPELDWKTQKMKNDMRHLIEDIKEIADGMGKVVRENSDDRYYYSLGSTVKKYIFGLCKVNNMFAIEQIKQILTYGSNKLTLAARKKLTHHLAYWLLTQEHPIYSVHMSVFKNGNDITKEEIRNEEVQSI